MQEHNNADKIPDRFDIQPLFPHCVVTECCRIKNIENDFYPGEHACMEKAVAKRRNEFLAGRTCARRALGALGMAGRMLGKGSDGSVLWPAGITGAISHNNRWCGAAVARCSDVTGIGFDVETVKRISMNISRKILTRQEMIWLSEWPGEEAQKMVALIFSAKESVYKALYPVIKTRISFFDAVITPSPDSLSFDVELSKKIADHLPPCSRLTGTCLFHDGDIFTGIVYKT